MRLLTVAPFLGVLGLALQPAVPVPQATSRAPEPLRLPAKNAQPVVELVIPRAADKQTMIEGGAAFFDARTREMQTSGNAVIRLPNGVQLRVRQAHVKLLPADIEGDQRVLITPLPDSPVRR
jgi:hypothetical protein